MKIAKGGKQIQAQYRGPNPSIGQVLSLVIVAMSVYILCLDKYDVMTLSVKTKIFHVVTKQKLQLCNNMSVNVLYPAHCVR